MSLPNNCHGISIPSSGPQSSSSDCSSASSSDSSGSLYESSSQSPGTSNNFSVQKNGDVAITSRPNAKQTITAMEGEKKLKGSTSKPPVPPSYTCIADTNEQVASTGASKGRKRPEGVKGLKGMKGFKGVSGFKGVKGLKGGVQKGLKGLKGLKVLKGMKGVQAVKCDSVPEGKLTGKDRGNMVEISSRRHSTERVPQAKRLSSTYAQKDDGRKAPGTGSKAPEQSENLTQIDKISDLVAENGKQITKNVAKRVDGQKSADHLLAKNDANVNKLCEDQKILKVHTCATAANEPKDCRFEMVASPVKFVDEQPNVCSNSKSERKPVSETSPPNKLSKPCTMRQSLVHKQKTASDIEKIEKNNHISTKNNEAPKSSTATEPPKAGQSVDSNQQSRSFHYRELLGNIEQRSDSGNCNEQRKSEPQKGSCRINQAKPDDKMQPKSTFQCFPNKRPQKACIEHDQRKSAEKNVQSTGRYIDLKIGQSMATKDKAHSDSSKKEITGTRSRACQEERSSKPGQKPIWQNLNPRVMFTGLRSKPITEIFTKELQRRPPSVRPKEPEPPVMDSACKETAYKKELISSKHPDKRKVVSEAAPVRKHRAAVCSPREDLRKENLTKRKESATNVPSMEKSLIPVIKQPLPAIDNNEEQDPTHVVKERPLIQEKCVPKPTVDTVDYEQAANSRAPGHARGFFQRNQFRSTHVHRARKSTYNRGKAEAFSAKQRYPENERFVNKIREVDRLASNAMKQRDAASTEKVKDKFLSVHDTSNSSSETGSSDDPSPVTVSRMKRYDDFVSEAERMKFITGRMKQLEEERKRTVTIRGKWHRKANREEKEGMKQRKRTERKSSDFQSQDQERIIKDDRNRPLKSEELNRRSDQKWNPPGERHYRVPRNIETYDNRSLYMNNHKLGGRNEDRDLPPKNSEFCSGYGPRYERCKPLAMKGRSKEVRDANKAASYGVAKLGGDEGKVVRLRGLPGLKNCKIKMTNHLRAQKLKMRVPRDGGANSSEAQNEKPREGGRNPENRTRRKRARRVVEDTDDEEDVVRPATKKHRGRPREGSLRQ